jgi:hypothetical protein
MDSEREYWEGDGDGEAHRRRRGAAARGPGGGETSPPSLLTSGGAGGGPVCRSQRRSGLSSGELSRAEEEEGELGVRCCGGVDFLGCIGAIL